MDKKKKPISRWCKGVAVFVFVCAAMSIVYGCEIADYTWLCVALWELVSGGLLLGLSHYIERSEHLAGCCKYKDGFINALYELTQSAVHEDRQAAWRV